MIDSDVIEFDGGKARMYELIYDPTVTMPSASVLREGWFADAAGDLNSYIKTVHAVHALRNSSTSGLLSYVRWQTPA